MEKAAKELIVALRAMADPMPEIERQRAAAMLEDE